MKINNLIIIRCVYIIIFLWGIQALFHGFPDIERFFAEWMDERFTLTNIMKFGTLNFVPRHIIHPPLYHYLTFIPIGMFFITGKLIGLFHDKIEFARFYFNNTHYFFLIGRAMSYIFYWLAALMIFKIVRLFYERIVAHITTFTYLLIPIFIFDFSTTRMATLLVLNASIFLYFFLKYHLDDKKIKYLFLSAFFLGISTATKYNALFLGSIFIPALLYQLKNPNIQYKNFKNIIFLLAGIIFFAFLGFFICNPFFIIKYKNFVYNFFVFATVHNAYYFKGYFPAVFLITHIKDLSSTMYINFFGFLILLFGSWGLIKKDKKLSVFLFSTIFIFEIYFGLFRRNCSPPYYLNPLIPIIALIFSVGVDFALKYGKKAVAILIIFFVILFLNHFVVLRDFSERPTHLQKARAFIENKIPEFTNICIASNSNIPQLNMTRESYNHLIQTAPVLNVKGHKLSYKEMDTENYDSVFRELRIQSLTKKPQYNLIRWDKSINNEKDAVNFLKKNNIKYIISCGKCNIIDSKDLEDTGFAFLVKEFKANNIRVHHEEGVYLYKVEVEN